MHQQTTKQHLHNHTTTLMHHFFFIIQTMNWGGVGLPPLGNIQSDSVCYFEDLPPKWHHATNNLVNCPPMVAYY